MSLLAKLNPFSKLVEKGLDIIDQVVPDKDAAARLKSLIETMREETYRAALTTTTLPWADALHKLARPVLSFYGPTIAGLLIAFGHDLSAYEVGALLGVPTLYTAIKGKGR